MQAQRPAPTHADFAVHKDHSMAGRRPPARPARRTRGMDDRVDYEIRAMRAREARAIDDKVESEIAREARESDDDTDYEISRSALIGACARARCGPCAPLARALLSGEFCD